MAAKKRKSQEILVFMLLCICSLMLLSFCNGCESNRNELSLRPDVPLAWPAPPEKSRIRYLGVISTEADLKAKASWTQGLGELIFGKGKSGVFVAPSAVAIDQSDKLFVTESAGAAVHVFDLNNRTYKQFAELDGREKLLKPVGLAIVENRIYVVDSILRKVCVFDKKGKFIFSFGGERFVRPSGI